MGHFPMCVELTGKRVLLVGSGQQIREKAERLAPFGAALLHLETLNECDLEIRPALVIAGDLPRAEEERIAALCAARHIPINVVDVPQLCTFTFPAMVVRGDMTIAVSTGGKAPGAAACIKKQIQQLLPEQTEALLDWLADVRAALRQTHTADDCARLMRTITAAAFAKGDVLSAEEYRRATDKAERY